MMRTVAVDAMGGDLAPRVEIEGAVAAARTGEVRVLLVGQRERIAHELRRLWLDEQGRPLSWRGGPAPLPLSIRHAEQIITMEDSPSVAVRRKRDSSMRVAHELLAAGQVDAVVSAGNSGAMVGCGLFVLGRLPGVDRPGILTTLPSLAGDVVLLDTGANVECRPLHLVQYAVMGACYARRALGRPRPRVGVLANGTEPHKGTELTRGTHRLLREGVADIEYVGYVEGPDLFAGKVDVVVCDGFSGNLVLKISEGAAEAVSGLARRELARLWWGRLAALPLLPVYWRLRRRIDYAEQGGAPLLGVRGTVMICHGRSNPKAIRNAILRGAQQASLDLAATIGRAIEGHAALFARARGVDPVPSSSSPSARGTGGAVPDDETGQGREGQGQGHDETIQDSRSGPRGTRAGVDQPGSGEDGRHQRRVDHRAHGHQAAPRPG